MNHSKWLAGIALAAWMSAASAQILIGQTADFSNIAGAAMKEATAGARLYFDHVNTHGGINGQKIDLISLDDKFDPALAATNARELITQRKVLALFLSRGTPQTEAIVPLLSLYKVPLVAPSTGALVFHQPVNPLVFNVRSLYQSEAEKAVLHLSGFGISKVALLSADNSFGADGSAGVVRALDKLHQKPVLHIKFDPLKPDWEPLIKKVGEIQPQAVVFVATNQIVIEGTRRLREAGLRTQIVTLSNNVARDFVRSLGQNAPGTIVTQVVPGERATQYPMVKELSDLAAAKGQEVTPSMIEGYAAAKVLVEGLKRAGRAPTSESLVKGLDGMGAVDIGGLKIAYSPTDHTGLDYVEVSVIGADGKFRR
jgi:ABC-type branched-subunit amino acid transport system substrate-binding protein